MTNTFKIQSCYKVKIKTTNSSNDTFYVPRDKKNLESWREINGGDYLKCEEKICYVVTDNAANIYEMFGDSVIISVEKIGAGYTF